MVTPPDLASLQRSLGDLKNKKVLIIGDIMLDRYLLGQVERISPEAPVPVVLVKEERHRLGGAANVAKNIAQLEGEPHLYSVTGDDADARILTWLLNEERIAHVLVPDSERPTTVKTRIVALQQHQQMVRVDRERSAHVRADVRQQLLQAVSSQLDEFDVIVLSDYGKGLVSPSFITEFNRLLQSSKSPKKVLVDPKVKNFHLYTNVFLLTPNTKEAAEGVGMADLLTSAEILASGRRIFQQLHCDHLLITLGSKGMALFKSPDDICHIPTTARNVFDVTGAGDTVIATVALSLAAGHSLLTASLLANYAAGLVVGKVGTACATPTEIAEAMNQFAFPSIQKWND